MTDRDVREEYRDLVHHTLRFLNADPKPARKAPSPPTPELTAVVQTVFPRLKLRGSLPDDRRAVEASIEWGQKIERPAYLLLHGEESSAVMAMLDRLVSALKEKGIGSTLIPTHSWEHGKLWHGLFASPSLKLIVVSQPSLDSCPRLRALSSGNKIGEVAAMVTAPWDRFLNAPDAKRQLWQALLAFRA